MKIKNCCYRWEKRCRDCVKGTKCTHTRDHRAVCVFKYPFLSVNSCWICRAVCTSACDVKTFRVGERIRCMRGCSAPWRHGWLVHPIINLFFSLLSFLLIPPLSFSPSSPPSSLLSRCHLLLLMAPSLFQCPNLPPSSLPLPLLLPSFLFSALCLSVKSLSFSTIVRNSAENVKSHR